MNTEGHDKGLGGSHNRRKEDVKEKDIKKKTSDEEFKRELVEMKAWLNVLMELLQKDEEDKRYGWVLRKKVKRHKLQVKFKHKLSIQKRKENVNKAEMEIYIMNLIKDQSLVKKRMLQSMTSKNLIFMKLMIFL